MYSILTTIFLVLVYLWGSVPYSIIVSRLKGVNLLEFGSRNAGATNVYRALGMRYAALVFFLDFLKGFLACYISGLLFMSDVITVLAAALVIIGHTFSPFLRFKGGKGAATGLGVLLCIQPWFLVITGALAAVIIRTTRYVSVATITGALLIIVMAYVPAFGLSPVYQWFLTFMAVYVIYKHKTNISRLIRGEEKKV